MAPKSSKSASSRRGSVYDYDAPRKEKLEWWRDENGDFVEAGRLRVIHFPNPSGKDPGQDNFSFHEDHFQQWALPHELVTQLPRELLERTRDWSMAGAALCTALESIGVTVGDAMGYAYPDKSRMHSYRRDELKPTKAGAEASPITSPMSPMGSPILPVTQMPASAFKNGDYKTGPPFTFPKPAMGMESPPFTPLDTTACATPALQERANAVLPDMARLTTNLNNQLILSPVATPEVLKARFDDFNPDSWEFYLTRWEWKMDDLKYRFRCLKGFGRVIDVLMIEMRVGGKPAPTDFQAWWAKGKAMVAKYEARVKETEAPKLEDVQAQWIDAWAQRNGFAVGSANESCDQ